MISCPIYTQLVYTQIEVFQKILFSAGLYAYGDLNMVLNAAYGAMPGILIRYNDLALNSCAGGGPVALVTDIIKLDKSSAVFQTVGKAAKDKVVAKREAEKLIGMYGSELPQIGREDFLRRTKTVSEAYIVWPFDEAKEYLAYCCLCEKPA